MIEDLPEIVSNLRESRFSFYCFKIINILSLYTARCQTENNGRLGKILGESSNIAGIKKLL